MDSVYTQVGDDFRLDGEMLIRKLDNSGGRRRLLPACKEISPIEINESSSFDIWGVVTYVIHSL